MAKDVLSSQFVCRSCRQLLAPRSQQSRSFSRSTLRFNQIPNFKPTSSAELDSILLDWRHRVFTPAALSKTHQKLIYKKSRWPILENDPGVTVTMSDGEEVKLDPMIKFDKPSKRKSLSQMASILGKTNESDAWAQVPAFLDGMELAKSEVPVWFRQKLSRKASEQGKANVIKECAAMVKTTGMSLALRAVTRELFLGSHERFVEARINGEDFEAESKFTESLALMMESRNHCGGTIPVSKDMEDMRKYLMVIGVMLEIAATRALQLNGGKDVEGKTGSYSKKLLALAQGDILQRKQKERSEQALEDWIPIAAGLRSALRVNGLVVGQGRNAETELKNELQTALKQLDHAIEGEVVKIKTEANGKPRRCLIMLDKLRQIPS